VVAELQAQQGRCRAVCVCVYVCVCKRQLVPTAQGSGVWSDWQHALPHTTAAPWWWWCSSSSSSSLLTCGVVSADVIDVSPGPPRGVGSVVPLSYLLLMVSLAAAGLYCLRCCNTRAGLGHLSLLLPCSDDFSIRSLPQLKGFRP
jgi:hypothetical protein